MINFNLNKTTELLILIVIIGFIALTVYNTVSNEICTELNQKNINFNLYELITTLKSPKGTLSSLIGIILKSSTGFIVFIIFTIVLLYALKDLLSRNTKDFTFDSEYIDTKKFRNEPYYVEYINPYKTNLKKLDFNFRSLYNGNSEVKLFLKSKINEFLIGKYVKFHDVLTLKSQPFSATNFKELNFNQGFYFKDDTGQNTSLFIVKSDVINFQKSLTKGQKYIYIFEDSDLPYFDVNDNITIINNSGSILNTRELNPEKNYVYYEIDSKPEDLKYNILNKEHIPLNYNLSYTSFDKIQITPIADSKIKVSERNMFTTDNTSKIIIKMKDKSGITKYYNGIITKGPNTDQDTKDNIVSITTTGIMNDVDEKKNKKFFDESSLLQKKSLKYVYKKDIETNAIGQFKKKPIIFINKNNINRPLYYKNSKDKIQTIKYRDWLLDTYNTFLKTQFKGKAFKIKYIYKQYNKDKTAIFAKNLKEAKCYYKNSFDNSAGANKTDSSFKASGTLQYKWIIENIKDIKFDDNINDWINLKKNPNNNDYGFIVYLCNSSIPVDKNETPLDFLDNIKETMFDCIMPHIVIQHYKFNSNNDKNKKTNATSVLYENIDYLPYDPFKKISTDTNGYSNNPRKFLGSLCFIKLHKNILDNNSGKSVDLEWEKYIYNDIKSINSSQFNSVKISSEEYNKYKNLNSQLQTTKSYINSMKNIESKTDSDIYITSDFAFTNNETDYGIKMKIIAQTILNRYYLDNLASIINVTYNLSDLSLIPIKVNKNNYVYNDNDTSKKVIFNNRSLTVNNINTYYSNTSTTGIQELRTDFCNWLENIMKSTVWTKGDINNPYRPDRWTEKSLLKYINKSPFDKFSKKLNITTNSESSFNKENKSFIIINEKKVTNIPYFIKIGNEIQVIYSVVKQNIPNISSIELLNGQNNSNKINLGKGPTEIYDFTNNIISKKNNVKILNIYIHKDHPNIFTVKFNKIILDDDIDDYYSFSSDSDFRSDNDLKLLEPTTIANNQVLINEQVKLYSNKIYLNITKKNDKGQYLNPTATDKKINISNKYKDFPKKDIKINNTELISSQSTYLTFYSNDKLYSDDNFDSLSSLTIFTNSLSDNNINTFSYENNEKYHELIITEKKLVQEYADGPKTLKTFIKFKNPLVRFYRNVAIEENNKYKINYNIKDLIYKKIGLPIKKLNGTETEFMSIEDHFTTDVRGLNLMILKTMIIINESVKIHYNLPNNIGIEETKTNIPQLKCSNKIWIPYKFRNKIISNVHAINSRLICSNQRGESTMYLNNINNLSKYRLFDYENYLLLYLNIFETITGIYSDIDDICQKNKLYKTNKWYLPPSFNNYLSFDNFVLFYRNDKEILKDSNIKKEMLGKQVVVNNKIFDGNLINLKQSNSYNTSIVKTYLNSFIINNKIGEKGYSYQTALDICSKTFTAQNTNMKSEKGKNCKLGEYKQQTEKFNPDIYKNNKNRDKCFNIIYNTKTKAEIESLKKEGQFIFSTTKNNHNKNIEDKYKSPYLTIIPHRIAHMKDIKSALFNNFDWTGAGWTDMKHSEVKDNKSLLSLRTENDNKKSIDIYSNPNEVPNKGVICFGRKEKNESSLSKGMIQFKQREKELKEIMTTLQKNDERQSFNTKLGLYSMWSS